MKQKVIICNDGGGNNPTPLRSLQSFCRETPMSSVSAWRYRKRGWLKTVNICGRLYITAEAVAEFKRRAQAGEFAKTATTPKRIQSTLP